MRALLFCLLATLLATTRVVDAGSCSGNTGCYSCVSTSGCGWNPVSKKCASGNTAGPNVGNANSWICGNAKGCPNYDTTCNGYETCNSCTAAVGCGWDHHASLCRQGSPMGPVYGNAFDWSYTSGSCSAWNGSAVASVAVWVIVVPLLLFLGCVGCIVACVCYRRQQTTVVVTGGAPVAGGYQTMPGQPAAGYQGQTVYA